MENYKIRNALYVGDTVYTIGETIKLISKENKTITGKIFNFYNMVRKAHSFRCGMDSTLK